MRSLRTRRGFVCSSPACHQRPRKHRRSCGLVHRVDLALRRWHGLKSPQVAEKKLPSSGDSIDTWVSGLTAETVDTVDTVFNQSNLNVCETQNRACSTATMITMARLTQMMQGRPTSHWTVFGRHPMAPKGLLYVWYEGFGGLWMKRLGAYFTADEYCKKAVFLFRKGIGVDRKTTSSIIKHHQTISQINPNHQRSRFLPPTSNAYPMPAGQAP